jgi:hypothetical protein
MEVALNFNRGAQGEAAGVPGIGLDLKRRHAAKQVYIFLQKKAVVFSRLGSERSISSSISTEHEGSVFPS